MPFSADRVNPGKVLKGVESYNFDGNTLFDKIINLKLIRREPGTDITIRSDYEVERTVDTEGNEHFEFHTVKQKPSISVSYRQVGSSTAISVQVRIANLFFAQGDEEIFNNSASSNPVTHIKINMGYRSQFRAWPQQVEYAGKEALERFYGLDDFVYRDKNALINSGFSMTVKVLDSWPESNPPDRVVYFHCIVGTAESGLKFLKKDNYSFIDFFEAKTNYPAGQLSYMDRIFFLYVTRRFIKSNIIWKYAVDAEGSLATDKILVRGYKRTGPDGILEVLTEADRDAGYNEWVECQLVDGDDSSNGILSVKDAQVIGVPVTLSEEVRKRGEEIAQLTQANVDGRGGTVSKTVQTVPAVLQMDTLAAQIQGIEQSVFAGLKPFVRPDCSYMICHESEDAKAVFENYEDEKMYDYAANPKTLQTVILPAIYDRTVNGTRTLRFPFIGFLSTGMFLGFTNRYLLGSLVSFYNPRLEDRWYKVIYSDVEFDTDGDKNMCSAVCTDAEYAPGEKELETKKEAVEADRSVEWVDITVVKGVATEFGTITLLQWSTLAALTLGSGGVTMWAKPNTGGKEFLDDVASAFPDGKYSPAAAVRLLVSKNDHLKGSSWQEGTGIYAGIQLPWLKWGDTIKLPKIKQE